jgi:hypothetical protein
MNQTDWIPQQRNRRAARWLVAYCQALRERRPVSVAVRAPINWR